MKSDNVQAAGKITDSKQLNAADFFAGTFSSPSSPATGSNSNVSPAQPATARPSIPGLTGTNFTNIEIPDFLRK